MKNVKYGKCVRCGKTYDAVPDLTNCECGGILDIVYDYDYIKSVLTKEKLAKRENRSMWRYRELLPVEETTPDTPLRVGWSPLYEEPKLAELLGIKRLWVKDDGQNPTASLKDRASAMAVAKAMEAGAAGIVVSNHGGRQDHRLLLYRQRRQLPGRQRRRRRYQDLYLRSRARPQGQGGPADDLRRQRHLRQGQL